MKLILWSVTLLLCTASTVFAEGWEWVWPKPQGNNLIDIQFVGNALGFAVGQYGTLITTTDGGRSWQILNNNLPYNYTYSRVAFSDSLHGTVLGQIWISSTTRAVIFGSDDGGNTWNERFDIDSATFNDISFANRLDGIVVGEVGRARRGVLLRTTDGGQDWSRIEVNLGGSLHQIELVNRTFGFVCSDSALWQSANQGATWNRVVCPGLPAWTKITFCNENWGYADGYYGLYRTVDGALTWSEIADPSYNQFNKLIFANPSVGMGLTSSSNRIYSTFDGGYNWTRSPAANCYALRSLSSADLDHWSAVGGQGCIFASSDHGSTWTSSNDNSRKITEVAVFDSLHIWATTETRFMRSTNGGFTFDTIPCEQVSDFSRLFFTSLNNGWAVGRQALYHTGDGGLSWFANPTLAYPPWSWIRNFQVFDSLNLSYIYYYAEYGRNGNLVITSGYVRSSDGGGTWQLHQNVVPRLEQVIFVNREIGWARDAVFGNILRTSGGAGDPVWSLCFELSRYAVNSASLCPIDNLNCWLSCTRSSSGNDRLLLFRTSDGGVNWSLQDTCSSPGEITFSRGGKYGMWFGGGRSTFTSDSGDSWTEYPTRVSWNGWSHRMGVEGDLWSVRYENTWDMTDPDAVMRFVPPRVPVLSDEIPHLPAGYALSVYPNPFNSSATLRFMLPERSHVIVKIFDILGRCAISKDLGSLEAGHHQESIDGSRLSSGIYFTRIVAGNVVKTQKIVLLR
jgi:photosystem II stability/assembly factor-like uncharacterized protein